MREVLDRGHLHALFMTELRRHPDAAGSEFIFEIDYKPEGPGGCNWYPLATIELWRGDLMGNLKVFREVRESLSARYNVLPPADVNATAISVAAD
ncbi:hypothetical protein [Longimicrobium sp.]|uniref:hypothetical protein n=1 Tax=Longimicrobium sp. TaxID=2029185 RepID=UPI002E2FA4F1|nr:hypothetical protein [Longimicrobium sp.]HEX6039761.1 hypothetical protein [Longimicrobium sp.]